MKDLPTGVVLRFSALGLGGEILATSISVHLGDGWWMNDLGEVFRNRWKTCTLSSVHVFQRFRNEVPRGDRGMIPGMRSLQAASLEIGSVVWFGDVILYAKLVGERIRIIYMEPSGRIGAWSYHQSDFVEVYE